MWVPGAVRVPSQNTVLAGHELVAERGWSLDYARVRTGVQESTLERGQQGVDQLEEENVCFHLLFD